METCQSCQSNQAVDNLLFCESCLTIVCQGCQSPRHDHHKTNKVDVVASGVRKSSSDYASPHTGQAKIENIQEVEQLSRSVQKELLYLKAETVNKIKKHTSSVKFQVDQICDALIHNVTEVVSDDLKSLEEIETKSKTLAASISDMCEQAGQLSSDPDDFSVVTRGYSLCQKLRKAINTELPTPAFGATYLPGSINVSSLKDMCGEVSTQLLFNQCTLAL